jgi:glycosyltransferase involved in cell wall biosynthesis
VLLAGAREIRRSLTAAQVLVRSRSLGVALKNLAIVPKALWLARFAREWKADHIHCHWAGTTATMAMIASRVSHIPWSLTAHRWDIVENNLLAQKTKSARLVRFISADGLRMARERGAARANARVLHMGVDVPATVRKHDHSKRVVLCPARLVEVKGHRHLLDAWRILKNRGGAGELWLAGDGALRPQLESQASEMGIGDSVRFLGALPHRELLRMYEDGQVSVVVLASLDLGHGNHEGIPVGLIEAMGHGVPVVATKAGGTAELVVPGTGLLVPPGNSDALSCALEILLQEPELRERLGSMARSHVIKNYDIAQIAVELVREFQAASRRAPAVAAQYA